MRLFIGIFLLVQFGLLYREGRAETSWSFTTDIKAESVHWPKPYGENTNNSLNRIELIPNLTAKFSEATRFYFKPYFLWDPDNRSAEERNFTDIGEAYFRIRGESYSLQAGANTVNWGVTDGYNPLDVVNTHQYHDPLHSIKLGATSLMLSHSSESAEQELIYIPQQRASILPGTQSRWLPRKIYVPRTIDNDVILLLPENLNFHYQERQTLNNALDNNFGIRLQWHFGSIDLAMSGFEGVASFPLIQATVTGTVVQISPKVILQTDSDVYLRPKDYRHRVGGISWVSSQAGFLLKYASAYTQSIGDDPLLPGWSHESILGLEKNFNIGSEGLLVAILQHSFIRNQKDSDSNLSVSEIFRRAYMLGGRFSWGDTWTVTALGLYDSIRYSHFQQYSVARRFFDVWTLQVSAELIAGEADTPLGVYSDNDNYRLSLSRSF